MRAPRCTAHGNIPSAPQLPCKLHPQISCPRSLAPRCDRHSVEKLLQTGSRVGTTHWPCAIRGCSHTPGRTRACGWPQHRAAAVGTAGRQCGRSIRSGERVVTWCLAHERSPSSTRPRSVKAPLEAGQLRRGALHYVPLSRGGHRHTHSASKNRARSSGVSSLRGRRSWARTIKA